MYELWPLRLESVRYASDRRDAPGLATRLETKLWGCSGKRLKDGVAPKLEGELSPRTCERVVPNLRSAERKFSVLPDLACVSYI